MKLAIKNKDRKFLCVEKGMFKSRDFNIKRNKIFYWNGLSEIRDYKRKMVNNFLYVLFNFLLIKLFRRDLKAKIVFI
jgi:hypothetical protein